MANQVLTLTQLEDIMRGLTCSVLGIPLVDNTNPENPVPINQDKVRLAWPAKGAPGWGISDDVVFIRIIQDGDQYTSLRNVSHTRPVTGVMGDFNDTMGREVSYHLRHLVQWVLYGPNSYERAQLLRHGIHEPDAVSTLAAQHLAPIPEFRPVQRVPELFNSQWWSRVDWQAEFYELVIMRADVPYLHSADITVITEDGKERKV